MHRFGVAKRSLLTLHLRRKHSRGVRRMRTQLTSRLQASWLAVRARASSSPARRRARVSLEHLYGLLGYIRTPCRRSSHNPGSGKMIMKRQVVICVIVSLLGTALSDSDWIDGMTGSETYDDTIQPAIQTATHDQATDQSERPNVHRYGILLQTLSDLANNVEQCGWGLVHVAQLITRNLT